MIYLDYQATTPLDPRVRAAMEPYLADKFGNPHSAGHRFGWEAEAAVDVARGQVAGLINARPDEIYFMSGATEANNTAIKGVGLAYGRDRRHLVTVATEHKCVLESFRWLEHQGFEVTYLPVDGDGLLDPEAVRRAIRPDTAIVSVMAVNNEIGVIQPLPEIGAIVRAGGAKFHVDAAQAAGKIPLDVDAAAIDLMSLSAHKIYGPKGVGALYVRSNPRVAVAPLIHGGGQERGLRSGTLAPALIVGFGKAAEIAALEMAEETPRIERLARRFLDQLRAELPDIRLNGSAERRFWGNLNISFPGVDGDLLIAELRELAVSSGAACASGSKEPSYVLRAIGLPDALARASIRFGFGRMTTEAEVDAAARAVIDT
ncbi:MAG TPA: aminotransferase class V-fold PLP-dependent enzyme, partial [Sphingomonadales bacterium]